MIDICRSCGAVLDDTNWSPSYKHPVSFRRSYAPNRLCKSCQKEVGVKWRRENRSRYNAYFRVYDQKIKLETVSHYSPTVSCVSCGETDMRVLTIDHIHNDGAKDRVIRGLGISFYASLKKDSYPEGYQVLCMNCNWLKRDEERNQDSLDAIRHYSSGIMSCVKCGVSNLRVLTIDHLNAVCKSNNQILKMPRSGARFALWLKRHHYPQDYQVLCMNCQLRKRMENKEVRGRSRLTDSPVSAAQTILS